MYRPPAASGKSGPGVSGAGYDGAESFFEQAKTVAGELRLPGMPSGSQEAAAAKAAVDAYMSARNGLVSTNDAFFHEGKVPGDFPQVDLKDNMSLTDAKSPLAEIGKAITEMMSNMGDMLNQIVQSPMGIIGSILSFLLKIFSEVASNIGQALSEAMQAAATAVEDAWKKSMQVASGAGNTGLQPLELYNQAATTQTMATALKNTSST